MSVVIKAGSYCPVCRGMTLEDCRHPARYFNAENTSKLEYRLEAAEARAKHLAEQLAQAQERADKAERSALFEIRDLKEALFMCAAHCQGGHGKAGYEAAQILGVPHPIRMDTMKAKAVAEGFDPDLLWPWLRKMEEDRAAIAKEDAQ